MYCGINFLQYGKGRHILNVIINTGQEIRGEKISPTRAGGEIGKNFHLYGIINNLNGGVKLARLVANLWKLVWPLCNG